MTDPSSTRTLPPWRLPELLFLYVTTAVGAVVLAVGWWGTSGTAKLTHQIPWLCLAAGGLIVLGAGNSLWLLLGRRAVADRRRVLLAAFDALPVPAGPDAVPATDGAGPRPVAATGMGHYHRPDCQLVAGKAVRAATPATHEKAGRRPCGMCRP